MKKRIITLILAALTALTVIVPVGADETAISIAGDVNGDGKLNARDIITIMRFMLGQTPVGFNKAADLNGDGNVNAKGYYRDHAGYPQQVHTR